MEDRYARYGAATGIAFVALMVVSFNVMPEPPALDSPVAEWTSYYADNQNAINTSLLLVTVALFFFVWFLGTLVSALRVASGSPRLPTIAFGGGLVATAAFFVGITAAAVAAHRPEEVTPELTRALNDGFLLSGIPAIGGVAALFAATALVVLRTDLLPSWAGWLAAVTAALQLLTFGALYTDSGAFAGDGELALFVPFIASLVTVLALSILLIQVVDDLNREVGIGDRVRGAVTGAASGAAAGAQGKGRTG